MDSLNELPVSNTKMSKEESEIMNEYFGKVDTEPIECKMSWTDTFKVTGYGVLLFGILGNPWINSILSKIPQLSNPIILFCAKLFIFGICLLILSKVAS